MALTRQWAALLPGRVRNQPLTRARSSGEQLNVEAQRLGTADARLLDVNVLLWIVLALAFVYVSLMLFAAWIEHRDRQQGTQVLGAGRRLSKPRGQRDL